MAERVIVRWRLLRWWQKVLVIFLASRIVTTIIFAAFAAAQPLSYRTGASPDYFTFATLWDGQWYWLISLQGYPSALPHNELGQVTENAWAFLPGYPAVMWVVTLGHHLPFTVLAPLVSTVFAAGAALLFYKLLAMKLPGSTAMFAVVLFCTAPLSPILQVSYAESMALFLLFAALILLLRRRYLLLIPVAAAMALTRPSGFAFALLLLLHLIHRIATRRRDPFDARTFASIVAVGLTTAFAAVLWPIVAWIVTGSATAYTDTELVWRRAYIGEQDLLPFTPWIQGADWWLKWWHVPDALALPLGVAGVLVLVGGFGAFLLSRWARPLGADLRFWMLSYAVYLLAVFFPQSSTFRLLVPLAPALGGLAIPENRVYRAALVGAGILGQIAWLYVAWWVDGQDFTPP
ncbi:MAG TPA: hypothetical protein VGO65_08310 [Pseudolysinimonas sp.]|nr:hypothetical protein [Pseudolysinimonas sp.]